MTTTIEGDQEPGGLGMGREQRGEDRPTAVGTDRLVSELESGEVMVYDLVDHHAHCLDPTSAQVWRLCDGSRSVREIARAVDVAADDATKLEVVGVALEELEAAGLIEPRPSEGPRLDRRQLLLRVGSTAAAAAIVPVVLSIVAPTPAAASTCIQSGGACTSNYQCCSGFCKPGGTCA